MQTRCPHCQTLFRLRPEHLAAAAGQVRCGRCGQAFVAQPADPDSTLPATGHPPPASAPAQPPAEASKQAATAEETDAPLPELLRPSRPRRSPLWVLGVLLLIGAALAQVGWWGRDYWIRLPEGRQVLEALCDRLGCELPPQRAPELFRIETREVSTHPDLDGILRVRMAFVNRAPFVQPHPRLQVTFFRDEVVPAAQRTFQPEEYLRRSEDAQALLLQGQMVYVELDVEDPGPEVTGFQFEFY
jgi:predicted Zn finger-like uncharacterized protein